MFNRLFSGRKTDVDEVKVEEFAAWFLENRDRLRASVENRNSDRQGMMKVLDEVEAQLALVYRDGYKGPIEFDYGGKDDNWELNLYHLGRPFLMKATKMIADRINGSESGDWTVNVGR